MMPLFGTSNVQQVLQSIKLRVLADMFFNQIGSNGVQVNNFQVFTYELYDEQKDLGDIKTTVVNDGGEYLSAWSDLVNHHGTVVLEGVVTPTDPEVWEINGNDLIIRAENVLIKENVHPQDGYVLKIFHSGAVNMDSVSDFLQSSETIQTQFYTNEQNGLTPIDDEYINTKCNSDNYLAHVPAATKKEPEVPTDFVEEKDAAIVNALKVKLYPNPANNEVNVNITQGKFDNCTVSVFSSAGQVLIHEKVAENLLNGFAIETSALTNGYYILELRSSTGQVIREQFVVQH
jgi:hypothetical protein